LAWNSLAWNSLAFKVLSYFKKEKTFNIEEISKKLFFKKYDFEPYFFRKESLFNRVFQSKSHLKKNEFRALKH
jgi:hypothetical protein